MQDMYKINNTKGIGTFQEKTLHKVIKNYYDSLNNNKDAKKTCKKIIKLKPKIIFLGHDKPITINEFKNYSKEKYETKK